MKRLITIVPLALIMLMVLGNAAYAAYEPDIDYMEVMIEAAKTGDYEKGYAAELARNEKIDALGLTYEKSSFSDLVLSMSQADSLQSQETTTEDSYVEYEAETDYSQVMKEAVTTGDYEKGYAAELLRNKKIDVLGLQYPKYSFNDLMLLSKIIYAEAGSEWLTDDWKMCVGEVVMNRVASPEFPGTIEEVLTQPGQYYGSGSSYFNRLIPSYRCAAAAARLLNGHRLMEKSVVFQANFKQGGGTCLSFYDNHLGWTYFCYSNRPDLYTSVDFAA